MSRCGRRRFIKQSLAFAATLPISASQGAEAMAPAQTPVVALARCPTYQDADVRRALETCFTLLGGIAPLVHGKTVTVKVNLTGHDFSPFRGLPPGETYMTHFSTA